MRYSGKLWPWQLLLAVILILISAGIYSAVQRNDYEWRWYRVPQYFAYEAEDVIKAPFDGTVTAIAESGSTTTVTLQSDAGEVLDFKVDTGTVRVSENELLFDGDALGFVASWRMGPLLDGFFTTIWISVVASVLGLIIGLIAGLMKISKNFAVRNLSTIYIELIRGTPLLVQIYIAYFFIGAVFDLHRNVCGIGALALFAGAYVAEIIRAGIQSIPRGQMEAARSLGMSTAQAMIDIILPQAFKRVLPPLAGQFISLIKDSSLLSIIAIIDLVKTGREIIATTFSPFEIWLLVAAMYLNGDLSPLAVCLLS
jgi:polar amino acid transport system permease protein